VWQVCVRTTVHGFVPGQIHVHKGKLGGNGNAKLANILHLSMIQDSKVLCANHASTFHGNEGQSGTWEQQNSGILDTLISEMYSLYDCISFLIHFFLDCWEWYYVDEHFSETFYL